MMDEYNKLHEQFIDLIAEYHNAHILMITRKNEYTIRPLKKIVHNIGRVVLKMKKNNVKLAKDLLDEKHQHWEKVNSKRKRVKK